MKNVRNSLGFNLSAGNFVKIAVATILFGAGVGIFGDALKGEQPFVHWLAAFGWIDPGAGGKLPEKAMDNIGLWRWQIVILLFCCVALGWILFELLPKEAPIKELDVSEGLGTARALIYCPSTSNWKLDFQQSSPAWVHAESGERFDIPASLPEAINLCNKINKPRDYVSLQQFLRLLASGPALQRIELVCSKQTLDIANDIRKLLAHLGLARIEVKGNLYPVDTEKVSAVYDHINRLVYELTSKQISERDIIIDVTGGQKPFSVGAAAITLHNGLRFSYVSTTKLGEVSVFNMQYDNRSSVG